MARAKTSRIDSSPHNGERQGIAAVATLKTTGPGNLEEMIRHRAYELFEQRGRQHGHAYEDWLRAEAEIRQRLRGTRTA